ncbi:MAG: TIGR03936 family radical SAM-associated protein [Aminipila sp.]
MAKYVLKFSKEGFFKYTSHLDLLRLFKRSFKRVDIKLAYSQGFNPHPKMGFAQPLSLGYSSIAEILEFETIKPMEATEIKEKLDAIMPTGLKIMDCTEYMLEGKSLAALTVSAEYLIGIPCEENALRNMEIKEACESFLAQKCIIVQKRQKKSKQMADVDIKNKIIKLDFSYLNNQLIISTLLDAGSESNLSPELLIDAIIRFFDLEVSRYNIEVMRKKINFSNGFSI